MKKQALGVLAFCLINSQAMAQGVLSNTAEIEFYDKHSWGNAWIVTRGFSYEDPDGVDWQVHAGFVSNLASIWIPDTPLLYRSQPELREAALAHDQYLACKTRSASAVHGVFYHLLLNRGVDLKLARIMKAIVTIKVAEYEVGSQPKWSCPTEIRNREFIEFAELQEDLAENTAIERLLAYQVYQDALTENIQREFEFADVESLRTWDVYRHGEVTSKLTDIELLRSNSVSAILNAGQSEPVQPDWAIRLAEAVSTSDTVMIRDAIGASNEAAIDEAALIARNSEDLFFNWSAAQSEKVAIADNLTADFNFPIKELLKTNPVIDAAGLLAAAPLLNTTNGNQLDETTIQIAQSVVDASLDMSDEEFLLAFETKDDILAHYESLN